jgi:hypothetical protein
MNQSNKRPSFAYLSIAALLAVALSASNSAQSQSSVSKSSKQQNPQANLPSTAFNIPEWKMSDDEFKEYLSQAEVVIAVYESSLNDLELYIDKQQKLPYRAGKMILDDVKDCRSDIDDLRGEIESLRGERHLIDEILLANALQKIVRDEIDLEKDEKCVALAEYELGIQFPSPSGLSGCANLLFALCIHG